MVPWYVGLCLGWVLSGCMAWSGDDNPVPAYLDIAPFTFQAPAAGQGSASAAVGEVWVRVNGDFLGVYSLPARVPVLASGLSSIQLDAGILENGLSATPDIYPFYQPVMLDAHLEPGNVFQISPQSRYRPETRFPLVEGFEGSGHLFQVLVSGDEANRMQVDTRNPFEGRASGRIYLDSIHPVVELASTTRYSGLLSKGAFVYLELNYKSDVPVGFGLLATPRNGGSARIQYVAGFNPGTSWKKIYFNLSPAVSGSILEDYQVILKAAIIRQADGTLSRNNAEIQLDNIKLVHF